MTGANLFGAELKDAVLVEADLSGANLYRAKLIGANLRGSVYDEKTEFDAKFDPEKHGMVKKSYGMRIK